jgi:glycerol-3-phosphate dehydrogenase
MALTLVDFMDRRAALFLFSPDFGLAGAEAATEIMSEALGWDADRRTQQLAEYRELATEHTMPST